MAMICGNCKFGVTELSNNSFHNVGGEKVYDIPCTSCRLFPKWEEHYMEHYCFQHQHDEARELLLRRLKGAPGA